MLQTWTVSTLKPIADIQPWLALFDPVGYDSSHALGMVETTSPILYTHKQHITRVMRPDAYLQSVQYRCLNRK